MKLDECLHLQQVDRGDRDPVEPRTLGCEECLAAGDWWVHLRLCMSCGHVGCCNDSPNRHATAHFKQCGHPVIKSFEPGELWAYCYEDDTIARSIESFPVETPAQHISPPGEPSWG